jgi:hypothetical protein
LIISTSPFSSPLTGVTEPRFQLKLRGEIGLVKYGRKRTGTEMPGAQYDVFAQLRTYVDENRWHLARNLLIRFFPARLRKRNLGFFGLQ